jgi:hypothetical protein
MSELSIRQDIASQLEAIRDLQGIENIRDNKALLSNTRKELKDVPEGTTISGVNKLFRAIRGGNKKISELTAKDLPSLMISKEAPKNKTHKDLPGQKLTSDEFRAYNTTGIYQGEFKNPLVLEQAKKLEGRWPKWNTGQSKSLEEFMKQMSKGWNMSARAAKLKTQRSDTKHVRGHVTDAASGGSNWPGNIVNQPEASYAKGMKIGEGGLISNETLRSTFKHPDDLKMAGFTGENVAEAFQEYLMEGDKNKYQTSDRFTQDQRSRMAHEPGRTAEGQGFKFEQQNAERQVQEVIAEASKASNKPKVKAKRLFTGLRTIASGFGQSNNPIANMGGDLVGAVMDGVSYLGDPSKENAIDLALSSSQVATNLAALGLAAVPIPGARPGAFALMKLGDNIGKVERLWNISRPVTKDTLMKLKKGSRNQRSELKAITRDIKFNR